VQWITTWPLINYNVCIAGVDIKIIYMYVYTAVVKIKFQFSSHTMAIQRLNHNRILSKYLSFERENKQHACYFAMATWLSTSVRALIVNTTY